MCEGVALSWRDLPESLIRSYCLDALARRRSKGDREYHFLSKVRTPLIPAWHERQLEILPWGNDRRINRVPLGTLCRQEDLESGIWAPHQPLEVTVPAAFALQCGVWYQVREGLRGVLVHDARGQPRVYVLTQPASHYYNVMTRSTRMPLLIGQVI